MPQPWVELLDALVATRRGALVGYAYVFTGDVSAAEDLVHDALVRTFAKPRRLDSLPEAEAYVRKAVATTFLNGARRAALFRERAPRLAGDPHAPGADAGLADRDVVHRALLGLSPRERACVVLRHYDEMSIDEVAASLGIASGSVKRYLSDAAGKLRANAGLAMDDADERVRVTERGAR